ncbi:MAG: acetate--CoA ligase family protein [Albidovulum sp.]|nr:acetate--CoA ligase family protein [Albidovulum sp.]
MSNLARMFRPRNVAVYGGTWAESVVANLRSMNFKGGIWPIHPVKSEVGGIRCVRSAAELPEPPDVAFVGVNRHRTPSVLAELSRIGAGGAVCFASGFAESGIEDPAAKELQKKLLRSSRDMPLLGPNCYGYLNFLDDVAIWPDQHGGRPCNSGVAVIGQSSNILINLTMQARALPIAFAVAVGNQARLSQAAIADFLINDERITAVGLHIEGFGDIRSWEKFAISARRLGKPVIALKAGKSAEAMAAAVSHTASIMGSDAGAAALLKRLGIVRVPSLTEFAETLKILHMGGPLPGKNLVSLSCSGGEAALLADCGRKFGFHFPDVSESQTIALRSVLGHLVHIANPLDYHTFIWNDEQALRATFEAMLEGRPDLAVIIIDFPRRDRCSDESWHPAVAAIVSARKKTGVRTAAIASMPENMPEHWSRKFSDSGIIPLLGIEDGLAAAAAAAEVYSAMRRPAAKPLLSCEVGSKPVRTVGEYRAKTELANFGLSLPISRFCSSPESASEAAKEIGFPVALKGAGFEHKTEAGAIKLGLRDSGSVLEAAKGMASSDGYLVEQYIEESGVELIIGVVRDPSAGFLLAIGAGGVLAELRGDTQHLLLPVEADDIGIALRNLKIWPLLEGFRGGPPVDRKALVKAVLAVAAYAESNSRILAEIEVNPYLALSRGGYALDALIRKFET